MSMRRTSWAGAPRSCGLRASVLRCACLPCTRNRNGTDRPIFEGPLEWLVGLYYTDEEADTHYHLYAANHVTGAVAGSRPVAADDRQRINRFADPSLRNHPRRSRAQRNGCVFGAHGFPPGARARRHAAGDGLGPRFRRACPRTVRAHSTRTSRRHRRAAARRSLRSLR